MNWTLQASGVVGGGGRKLTKEGERKILKILHVSTTIPRVPFCLHPHQRVLSVVFYIIVILTGVK